MKYLLLFIVFIQMSLFGVGCAPFRDVGDKVGEGVGEMTDELGGARKVGKGDDAMVIHPADDKKIKMQF